VARDAAITLLGQRGFAAFQNKGGKALFPAKASSLLLAAEGLS
jgi:hypothetical protein